ncbi:GLPGLI family protein [Mucilaginibacter calamicampi]|uniref:GLPGLI family protein n=1 Tax=Mucilaginibacter calamicampi TaxID=1302352 RepID=A0ABW2YW57_9SPHI
MKTLINSLTLLLIAVCNFSYAQNARFTTSGTIQFEKSSNTHAIVPRMITKDNEAFYKPAFEQQKATQPQFRVLKSEFKFADNKTLFTPIAPETRYSGISVPIMEQYSTVYTDLGTNIATSQKEIYGDVVLLTDTARKINWKITDETRDIAGYPCRRANALIMDSIYVVAFYTDKIPVSGGPESFNGLPGMILQVALPHENISWVATKVTDMAVPAKEIVAPKKGKVTSNKDYRALLDKVLKGQGNAAIMQLYYKAFLL